jgi:hypothetical protein
MKWLLGLPILFLALLLLLFVTKVKIKVHFHHQQDGDDFYIKFRAWFGILRYTIAVPIIKLDDDSAAFVTKTKRGFGEGNKEESTSVASWRDMINNFDNLNQVIEHMTGFYKIVRDLLSRVKVKKFEWNSFAGTGDAAYTGMLAGGYLGLKGSVLALLGNYLSFKKLPLYTVTPDFSRAVFYTSFTCIIQIRVGEAILAGIKLLRYWNGEKAKFKTKIYKDSERQSI